MNRRTAVAGSLAALVMPAAAALAAAPAPVAATALFAEGATRQGGEAQTAFGGAFCENNTCRSLGRGTVTRKITSGQIQTGVDTTSGDLILVGYSVGGAGMYDRLREWEKNPALAPDPSRVVLIVTYGNPENKFGGENRNQSDVGLPSYQPYEHLDVVAQYDGVADNPVRFGFYSFINTAVFSRHFSYFDDLDINDPDNLVYQEGNTTYMLIPAKTLPMLRWVEPFVSAERLAELDAKYRPLVERDYDRPAYVAQGEGADWGNGTPPPSLAEPAEGDDPDEIASPATLSVSDEAGEQSSSPEADPSDADESDADDLLDAETSEAEDIAEDIPADTGADSAEIDSSDEDTPESDTDATPVGSTSADAA